MVSLEPGQTFGGYRIEGLVGRGGMGVVYRATELDLDRLVALKLIAPELAGDVSFRARFEHECRTAASIDHPNVIPIFDAGEEEGQLYLTMRYVSGLDLGELVSSGGPLDAERAATIIDQMGAALDAAHERGLVHRDVKPGNTLVTSGRGREHVYLTDFGLTKAIAETGGLTKTGMMVGTVDYMAPEQWEGRASIDARVDVYALGCVLHEALTGQIPFERDSDPSKMYAHLSEPPPRVTEVRSELPAELDDVISRAMAKSPEDRFQSAGDLGRAALAAAQGQAPRAPERSVAKGQAAPTVAAQLGATAPAPAARPAAAAPEMPAAEDGRRRALLTGGGVVALLAVTGAVLAATGTFSGGGDEPEPPPPSPSSGPGPRPTPEPEPEPPAPEPAAGVTPSQVFETLEAYAGAYTTEDLSAMSSLLAPNLVRQNSTDPPQNKGEALAEYADQFSQLDNPEYVLTGIRPSGGQGEGFAIARYLITDGGRDAGSGEISFHLVKSGRRLQIDSIQIRPD